MKNVLRKQIFHPNVSKGGKECKNTANVGKNARGKKKESARKKKRGNRVEEKAGEREKKVKMEGSDREGS